MPASTPFDPLADANEIFRTYAPRLEAYFLRRKHPKEICRDLTQETFKKVFTAQQTFPSRKDFENWMFAVAENVRKNQQRYDQTGRRRGYEESLDARKGDALEGMLRMAQAFSVKETDSPELKAQKAETRRVVARAVEQLPPQQRQCVFQYYFQDLPYKVIAEALLISTETVKTHLKEGRKSLERLLAPHARELELTTEGRKEGSP